MENLGRASERLPKRPQATRALADADLRFLLEALRARWYRLPLVTHQKQSFQTSEVMEVLGRRLPVSISSDLIFDHGGLLWMIEQIRAEGLNQKPGSSFSLLMRARSAGALGRYITHLLIAARVYQPFMTEEQKRTTDELRAQVLSSVKNGELTFARPTIYDDAIAAMFPEMGHLLGNVVGTEGYALKRKREQDKKNMEATTNSSRVAKVGQGARLRSSGFDRTCRKSFSATEVT